MYGRSRSILAKMTLMMEFSTGRNLVGPSGGAVVDGDWCRASTVTEGDNGLMFVGAEALLLAFTLVFNLESVCLLGAGTAAAAAVGLPPGLLLLAPLLTLAWCPASGLSPEAIRDEREWLFIVECCVCAALVSVVLCGRVHMSRQKEGSYLRYPDV